jgi:hypothetical protein
MRVQRGEISPADAESEAKRLGLGGLASEPDPNEYDPIREPYWSLPMAVAWIAYRSADAVRNWWNDYRKEFSVWRYAEWQERPDEPVQQGYFLEGRPAATLVRLRMVDTKRQDADDSMSAEQAIQELWQALQLKDFEATGVEEETGKRVSIPAEHWHGLTWFEESGKDVIRPQRGHAEGCYREVIVPAEAVRARWPAGSKPQLALPELMKPEGAGYMPLYCAAQWIATHGGSVSFDPSDESVWKPAYEQLLARIASEEIKVVGSRNGERQPVLGYHFAGCRVSYPFVEEPFELLLSNELYLSSFAYLDEEHWLKGHDDSLQNRHGRQWGRLMVLKSDVAKLWPSDEAAGVVYPLRSGAPGRPTSMHLVEAEFDARCARSEVAASLADEAEHLADWLKSAHPSAPPLTAKTIKNNLRVAYRQHKETRN